MSKKKGTGKGRIKNPELLRSANTLPQKADGSGVDYKKVIEVKGAEREKSWVERTGAKPSSAPISKLKSTAKAQAPPPAAKPSPARKPPAPKAPSK